MIFVDSNVLVYAELGQSQWHPMARRALTDIESLPAAPCISQQVLRECLAALTRPQQGVAPAPVGEVMRRLRLYARSYQVLGDGADVLRRLFELVETRSVGGKQIHDANLVATMLAHGVTRLLTHNAEDFRRFEPLIEILPLGRWAARPSA